MGESRVHQLRTRACLILCARWLKSKACTSAQTWCNEGFVHALLTLFFIKEINQYFSIYWSVPLFWLSWGKVEKTTEILYHIILFLFLFFRVNGGVQFGTGNGLQNNNLLMTVLIGLGVISLLNIVTSVVSPLLKPTKDAAAATPATNATTPAAAARSLPEMVDLASQVYKAIESLGKEFKQEWKTKTVQLIRAIPAYFIAPMNTNVQKDVKWQCDDVYDLDNKN